MSDNTATDSSMPTVSAAPTAPSKPLCYERITRNEPESKIPTIMTLRSPNASIMTLGS